MESEKTQIRVPTEILEEIRKLAAYDDRSMSNYIVRVLRQHLREKLG